MNSGMRIGIAGSGSNPSTEVVLRNLFLTLCLLAVAAPGAALLGCGGSGDSGEARVVPETVKTRMTYYAMPG